MRLVRLTRTRWVNPDHVRSVEFSSSTAAAVSLHPDETVWVTLQPTLLLDSTSVNRRNGTFRSVDDVIAALEGDDDR